MTQKQWILTLKIHKPRQICSLKLRMLVKSSDVAGKLFQTFTTRLQRKYFRTSTRLWHTNSLQVCPRVVSFELIVKNLEQSRSTRPKIILYVYMRSWWSLRRARDLGLGRVSVLGEFGESGRNILNAICGFCSIYGVLIEIVMKKCYICRLAKQ